MKQKIMIFLLITCWSSNSQASLRLISSSNNAKVAQSNVTAINCGTGIALLTTTHGLTSLFENGNRASAIISNDNIQIKINKSDIIQHFYSDISVISPVKGISLADYNELIDMSYPLARAAMNCSLGRCNRVDVSPNQKVIIKSFIDNNVMSQDSEITLLGILSFSGVIAKALEHDWYFLIAIQALTSMSGSPVLDSNAETIVGMVKGRILNENNDSINLVYAYRASAFSDVCSVNYAYRLHVNDDSSE